MRPRTPERAVASARGGQSMIESVVVMLVVCLLLFGMLQLAHAFAASEVLRHAAARAARARAVGFNGWMVTKTLRAAAIPNAGRMLVPAGDFSDPSLHRAVATLSSGDLWDWSLRDAAASPRAAVERARIGDYMESVNEERADQILDYEDWDAIDGRGLGGGNLAALPASTLQVEVRQPYALAIMVRALYDWVGALTPPLDSGVINLGADYRIENHYPLYLEDEGR